MQNPVKGTGLLGTSLQGPECKDEDIKFEFQTKNNI